MPDLACGRQYKSRRNRPCDLCRSRKAACVITTRPPCDLCRTKGQQCTFVKGPGTRRRLLSDCPSAAAVTNDTIVAATTGSYVSVDTAISQGLPNGEAEVKSEGEGDGDGDGEGEGEGEGNVGYPPGGPMSPEPLLDNEKAVLLKHSEQPQPQPQQIGQEGRDRSPSAVLSHSNDDNNASHISLEDNAGRPYRFVGLAGELDAYLIARRHCNQSLQSESPFTGVTYQYMKPLEMGLAELQPPPVFTVGDATAPFGSSSLHVELGSIRHLRQRFGGLVPNSLARELMRIFFRFVSPSFPVLSRRQMPETDDAVNEVPLSLLAAICASALPFAIYDDVLCVLGEAVPDADQIYRIACDALHVEHYQDARLATVQAALLVLQRPAREDLFGDAAAHWRMCAMLVADCQALGLHRNAAAGWVVLAPWEVRLRTRLWWAVVVTETWTAFGQGMHSHISDNDADVPLLTMADLDDNTGNDGDDEAPFCHLVRLTVILRSVHASFYTVQAAQRTSRDLQTSLDTSKHLFSRLKGWHQALPAPLKLIQATERQGQAEEASAGTAAGVDAAIGALSSSGTLRLAYVSAQLALFRALLRPLAMANMTAQQEAVPAAFWDTDVAVAIMKGALMSARELVRFIEGLTTADWDGFWHSWSKHNFALASTFLMHLLVLTNPSASSPLGGNWPGGSSGSLPGAFITRPHTNSISSDNSSSNSRTPCSVASPQAEGESSSTASGPSTAHYLQTMHSELEALTKRWRWALRLAQRGAGGRKGLMSVSLRRTEALFREWQIGRTENKEARQQALASMI